jgi:hypothetical protein
MYRVIDLTTKLAQKTEPVLYANKRSCIAVLSQLHREFFFAVVVCWPPTTGIRFLENQDA